jgi:TonB-linked SusC/RagA family outer membrane protein
MAQNRVINQIKKPKKRKINACKDQPYYLKLTIQPMRKNRLINTSGFFDLKTFKVRPGPILLLILLFSGLLLNAQSRTVTGKVLSEDGSAMPGVTVSVEGTTLGVITDVDGGYSISVPGASNVLVFSFVGMKTERVEINNQTVVNVFMSEELLNLEEVVVIGYGTIKKEEVTSAVSSVKSDNFNLGSVSDAGQLIKGKVAGLSVVNSSGDPLEESQIMLRGITSLFSSTAPLVLIDGVPGSINSVAPQDIESIDVLKDGSAAAIYGTRGTNGVILITTKRVSGASPMSIEYNGYMNLQTIARRPDLLDADDYRRLIAEGVNLVDNGYNTDWLDQILQKNPISYMNNLTIKGGTESSDYIATINNRSDQGIFIYSGLKQLNGRLDINHSMFKNVLKINVGFHGRLREAPATSSSGRFNSDAYKQAITRNPTDRVVDDNGNWVNRGIYMYDNPVALLEESSGASKGRMMRFYGNITLKPAKSITSKLLVSRTQTNEDVAFYRTAANPTSINNGQAGYASRSFESSMENLLEFTTEANKTFGDHRVSILGGYSYQDELNDQFSVSTYDFPSDAYEYNDLSLGAALQQGKATLGSYRSMSRLIGFFGRINYNYDDRYLVLASMRYEGSSKFGENHQWGMFPAVSLGWRINEEAFMENVTLISDLKLRLGYGVTGTAPSSPYLSLTRLSFGNNILYNGEWIKEIRPASNPNPDLRWEKKLETNVGLDAGILENRIRLTLDLYYRITKDMLWNFQVPVPPYLYSSVVANVGQVENKGLEALLEVVPVQTSDFVWNSSISYSTNKNRLISLSNELYETTNDFFDTGSTGPPIQQYTHRVEIGGPIGNFYGYKVVDIDEDGHWIMENADGERINSAAKTTDDKQVLGNGLPKHYLDWNNTLSYKNFQIQMRMRGAFGFQILNFQRMFYENPSSAANYNNLASGFDLVYGKVRLAETQEYTSYYIEDGDYWKIDNITCGYDFKLQSVPQIKSARVYVSASNILTLTGYKGLDPEVQVTGLAPGNDPLNKYPTIRAYTFGVDIVF